MTTEQTAENHVFELEVRVKAYGQADATISREYVSPDKSSTDGAIREVFESIDPACRAKMRTVKDGD